MKRAASSGAVPALHRCRPCSLWRAFFFIFCTPLAFMYLLARRQMLLEGVGRSGPKCIGWRATVQCLPLGPRDPGGDLACDQLVFSSAGYCLCEGNVTTARVSCGMHLFRCEDKCAQLGWSDVGGAEGLEQQDGLETEEDEGYAYSLSASDRPKALPKPLQCDSHRHRQHWSSEEVDGRGWEADAASDEAEGRGRGLEAAEATGGGGSEAAAAEGRGSGDEAAAGGAATADEATAVAGAAAAAGSGGVHGAAVQSARDPALLAQAASRVWDLVDELAGAHAPGDDVRLPGPRTNRVDWVLEGRAVPAASVRRLTSAVAGLIADLPPYPDGDGFLSLAPSLKAAGNSRRTEAVDFNDAVLRAEAAMNNAGNGNGNDNSNGNGNDSKSARGPEKDAGAAAGAAAEAGGAAGSAEAARAGGRAGLSGPVFSGRGVVMVGGGLHYLTPAWVSLHVLRKSGCTLPAEVWFPVEEFPAAPLERRLAGLGAACRRLAARDLPQRGYGVKIAALLLSSFREVLFLDSDNAVLRDPSFLFESPQYIATGALLWQDYWVRTAAPEISTILNISSHRLPPGTFESGQMVIDKARHWRGLLVAAYMNVYGNLFTELLTCYVGKGDKETFAYGMLSAGEDFWVSPVHPGSAGVEAVLCDPPPPLRVSKQAAAAAKHTRNSHTHHQPRRQGGGWWMGGSGGSSNCMKQFLGNTMVQYGTDGAPLFFHANYHKWDLQLPDSFEDGWNRRWQLLQPHGASVAEVLYGNGSTNSSHGLIIGAGYDVERYVYEVLVSLRCAPWFSAYYSARLRMGESRQAAAAAVALEGFHALPDFTTFRDFYRKGWRGSLGPLVRPPLTPADHLASWYFGGLRWRLRPWQRRLRRWGRKLCVQ